MRWFTLAVGAAAGYLLGSAEGRQNLQKMTANAQKVWNDPKTQDKVGVVKDKAQVVASDAKDKAASATSGATQAVQEKTSSNQPSPASNNETATTGNAHGADPDVVSDPSTPLADEGPAA